tara:strand:+ start:79 stop:459 length:381 start_codon:yes stop_codon:yes gene_type:complete
MLPITGAHVAPLIIGNLDQTNWKYMKTDIALEINFFVTATAQLGSNLGIDQAPDFRITCRRVVGNAQSIFVVNTIVFVKFARETYKLSPSRSFCFCLFFKAFDTYPLCRSFLAVSTDHHHFVVVLV